MHGVADPPVSATLTHLLDLRVPPDWERWSADDVADRSFPRRRALLIAAGVLANLGVLALLTDAVTGSFPPPAAVAAAVGVAAGPLLAAEGRPELVRRRLSVPPAVVGAAVALASFLALVGLVAITEASDVDCLDPRPEEVAAVAQRLRPDVSLGEAVVVEDGQLRYLTGRVTIGNEERVATWLVRVDPDTTGYVGYLGPEAAGVSVGLQPAPETDRADDGADCL